MEYTVPLLFLSFSSYSSYSPRLELKFSFHPSCCYCDCYSLFLLFCRRVLEEKSTLRKKKNKSLFSFIFPFCKRKKSALCFFFVFFSFSKKKVGLCPCAYTHYLLIGYYLLEEFFIN
jgi:hypothetical protein